MQHSTSEEATVVFVGKGFHQETTFIKSQRELGLRGREAAR